MAGTDIPHGKKKRKDHNMHKFTYMTPSHGTMGKPLNCLSPDQNCTNGSGPYFACLSTKRANSSKLPWAEAKGKSPSARAWKLNGLVEDSV